MASCDPDDTHNSLTACCQQCLDQLPPRHPARRVAAHQTRRETSTSSSSTSSGSIENRQPQLQIGKVYIGDTENIHDKEKETQIKLLQQIIILNNFDQETTSHLECQISESEGEDQPQDRLPDAHRWQHQHQWRDDWQEEWGKKRSGIIVRMNIKKNIDNLIDNIGNIMTRMASRSTMAPSKSSIICSRVISTTSST